MLWSTGGGGNSSSTGSNSRGRRRSSRYSKDMACETLLRSVSNIGSLGYRVREILTVDYSTSLDAMIEDVSELYAESPPLVDPMVSLSIPTSPPASTPPAAVPSPLRMELTVAPYARASRLLGLINIAMCPRVRMLWCIMCNGRLECGDIVLCC